MAKKNRGLLTYGKTIKKLLWYVNYELTQDYPIQMINELNQPLALHVIRHKSKEGLEDSFRYITNLENLKEEYHPFSNEQQSLLEDNMEQKD